MKPKLFIFFLYAFTIANSQNMWIQKANFGGSPRAGAVGFSIGSKGYIGTGAGSGYLKDFWEWDQATNIWTQKAALPAQGRTNAVGFSIGSKGYVGTGRGDISGNPIYLSDFWEWDQATNTWSAKSNFSGGQRTCAVGFSINNKGYIGTGASNGSTHFNDFWEWNQSTNIWIQKASLPATARNAAVGFSIGLKGYIGSGVALPNNSLKDFWEWDQLTNVWSQKTSTPGPPRWGAMGFGNNYKGYFGTGNIGPSTYSNDFWEFDPAINNWVQLANFGGGIRVYSVGFFAGLRGYVGVGSDGSIKNDFWEFYPLGSGVDDVLKNVSMLIFPNPFSSQTTLQTAEHLQNASLIVYNSSGQIVKRVDNLSGQTIVFHRDNFPSGLYFVRITQDDNTISADKFVIVDE